MSDIDNKVIAIQGYPVSPTGPLPNQILKYDGANWSAQDNNISNIVGTGVNEFTFEGSVVFVSSTEQNFASDSNVPVKIFAMESTSVNNDFHTPISYPVPTGVQNWELSILGTNNSNNDLYKSNLDFIIAQASGVANIFPAIPTATNLITNGDGNTWNAIATLISNHAHIALVGATGTNWSISGKIQEITNSNTQNFIPSDFSDLIVWLRADVGITLSGSNITDWADQSLEGNNVSQSDNDKRPTFNMSNSSYNDMPTISLNGSQYMDSIGNIYSQPNTIIICGNWLGNPADDMMVGTPSGNSNELFAHNTTEIETYDGVGGVTGGSTLLSKPTVAACIFNGSAAFICINNSQSPFTGSTMDSGSWNALEIGATNGGSNPMTGTIAEIIAYNRILSQSEIKQVFLYLGKKYDVATS